MTWILFYLIAGTPIATISGFNDKPACDYVATQIKKEFRPKKIACVAMSRPPTAR